MSERMTSVHLPGLSMGTGFADYGRKESTEMIRALREIAASHKASAEAILAASDTDFHVETYIGVYKQKNREVLQQGRKP